VPQLVGVKRGDPKPLGELAADVLRAGDGEAVGAGSLTRRLEADEQRGGVVHPGGEVFLDRKARLVGHLDDAFATIVACCSDSAPRSTTGKTRSAGCSCRPWPWSPSSKPTWATSGPAKAWPKPAAKENYAANNPSCRPRQHGPSAPLRRGRRVPRRSRRGIQRRTLHDPPHHPPARARQLGAIGLTAG
jgi:hypothetical protein